MTLTYSQAREKLAAVWDEVENAREAAIISRRGHEDMALIPAAELRSLQEAAYLLRSPRNTARLLAALEQSRHGTGTRYTVEELARSLGSPEERGVPDRHPGVGAPHASGEDGDGSRGDAAAE